MSWAIIRRMHRVPARTRQWSRLTGRTFSNFSQKLTQFRPVGWFGCPPRRNGNMQRELERRAKRTDPWMISHGIGPTGRARRIQLGRSSRMRSGSTTCSGTFGNGARIGSALILRHPWLTPKGRQQARRASRAEDATTAKRSTKEPPEEIAILKNMVRRASGSELWHFLDASRS